MGGCRSGGHPLSNRDPGAPFTATRVAASSDARIGCLRDLGLTCMLLDDDEPLVAGHDRLDAEIFVSWAQCEVGRGGAHRLVLLRSEGDDLDALFIATLAEKLDEFAFLRGVFYIRDPLVDGSEESFIAGNALSPLRHSDIIDPERFRVDPPGRTGCVDTDRDSLELLRDKRAQVETWPDGAAKERVLRAIDSLLADIGRGVVSFTDLERRRPHRSK